MESDYRLAVLDSEGKEVPLRDIGSEGLAKLLDIEKISWPPKRKRLPTTRRSLTHKFNVAGHKGYATFGLYENGSLGEVFITMAKEGSTMGGMMDAFGTSISVGLQYGVPGQDLCKKFIGNSFEPHGHTTNSEIPQARSIVDYLFRFMDKQFYGGELSNGVKDFGGEDDN
jgi:ribonucleoside-diphosphate reductase alpha chain